MNYTELTDRLKLWVADTSEEFTAALPSIIENAQRRLERVLDPAELYIGYRWDVPLAVGTFLVDRPSDVAIVKHLALIDAADGVSTVTLEKRTFSWIRSAYPNALIIGTPRVYAEVDENTYWIAPSLNSVYFLEILYRPLLPLLTSTAPTNWLSQNYGELLFYSTLIEAAIFHKNADVLAYYSTADKERLQTCLTEVQQRKLDISSLIGV